MPPLRSINAPAATTRPPASSTTRIASSVEPPVVHTSSTTSTCMSGRSANPLSQCTTCRWHPAPQTSPAPRRPPRPLRQATPAPLPAQSPRRPAPGKRPHQFAHRKIERPAPAPTFPQTAGYCSTSAHCTYVPLCSPLDSSKWPCRMAPAVSNIRKISSRVSIWR